MSDDDKDCPTILNFLNTPEDYEKMVRSLVCKVSALEEKVAEHERFQGPARRIAVKIRLAIEAIMAGAVAAYITGWHPF